MSSCIKVYDATGFQASVAYYQAEYARFASAGVEERRERTEVREDPVLGVRVLRMPLRCSGRGENYYSCCMVKKEEWLRER